MAVVTMVIGDSGQGKSTSLRNVDPFKSLVIQPVRKSLPFRSKEWRKKFSSKDTTGSIYVCDNYALVHKVIDAAVEAGKKRIIIDDSNYFMQNASLRRASEKGYEKFSEMAVNYVSLFEHCRDLPDDVTVYFFCHTQKDEYGFERPKTVGKMIDNQVVLEGLFTIVLKAYHDSGKYYFATQTNGMDCVKSPMGMFDEDHIENDLNIVDKTIREYEGIEEL